MKMSFSQIGKQEKKFDGFWSLLKWLENSFLFFEAVAMAVDIEVEEKPEIYEEEVIV